MRLLEMQEDSEQACALATIAKEKLNFPKAEIRVAICPANRPRPKILMNELVVDDGCSQHADGVLRGLIV